MIRSYTVSELEQMSGTTRRTISDYIAKGVLGGPSHRGRGARYPQKDLDVLTVLPRIRTLMKKEYPTLKDVSAFLEELSVRDINRLARLASEEAFVGEMRRLRVRNSLMDLLPYMAPERIDEVLGDLTAGQIRGIDAGRYQIGAVLDIEALVQAEGRDVPQNALKTNGNGSHTNSSQAQSNGTASWSVSWLNGHEESASGAVSHAGNVRSVEETMREIEDRMTDTATDLHQVLALEGDTQPELPMINEQTGQARTVEDRLVDIASRLEKLESMLDKT